MSIPKSDPLYPAMPRVLSVIIIISLVSACGGRMANPVVAVQTEDGNKACETLANEIRLSEYKITELQEERLSAIRGNILKGIFGGFTLGISLLFLDVRGAPQIELSAQYERSKYLQGLYSAKCGKGKT